MTTIDNNNYELWLLRYAEGELTAEEREVVETWLAGHPEAAEELALYGEAPRLERDESVWYAAVPQQHTWPLWPAALRWSAAAAVVLALMVPALRMGTMGHLETQELPLIAAAPSTPITQKTPIIQKTPKIWKTQKAPIPQEPSFHVESIASVDTIPVIPVEIIETTALIAFEDSPAEAMPVETESLIAYDRSIGWGDALLAANDAFNDNHVTHRIVSNLINRLKQ